MTVAATTVTTVVPRKAHVPILKGPLPLDRRVYITSLSSHQEVPKGSEAASNTYTSRSSQVNPVKGMHRPGCALRSRVFDVGDQKSNV